MSYTLLNCSNCNIQMIISTVMQNAHVLFLCVPYCLYLKNSVELIAIQLQSIQAKIIISVDRNGASFLFFFVSVYFCTLIDAKIVPDYCLQWNCFFSHESCYFYTLRVISRLVNSSYWYSTRAKLSCETHYLSFSISAGIFNN